jgi:hypothetical protein
MTKWSSESLVASKGAANRSERCGNEPGRAGEGKWVREDQYLTTVAMEGSVRPEKVEDDYTVSLELG